MVTSIYGIGRVSGAGLMLMLNGLVLVICLTISLLFRCNRKLPGRRRFLLGYTAIAVLADVVMFLMLFPGGEYQNRGIGAAYGALLYPVLVAAAAALLTAWNHDET